MPKVPQLSRRTIQILIQAVCIMTCSFNIYAKEPSSYHSIAASIKCFHNFHLQCRQNLCKKESPRLSNTALHWSSKSCVTQGILPGTADRYLEGVGCRVSLSSLCPSSVYDPQMMHSNCVLSWTQQKLPSLHGHTERLTFLGLQLLF